MEVDELPSISPDVDYEQILPIQQKRTVAFINHFIMNTVSLLNTFCQSCESRLMLFEYKLQKVEASLLILESQLASIPDLDKPTETVVVSETVSGGNCEEDTTTAVLDLPEVVADNEPCNPNTSTGPKACDDPRFVRFFKMIQFGVPPAAVKLKMESEGVDASILDRPNEVVSGQHDIDSFNDADASS